VSIRPSVGDDFGPIGSFDHQRAEPPHFFFQHADRRIHRVVAQGIRADQLGEVGSLVGFGHLDRAHLDEAHRDAAPRDLVGSLAACESGSDHGYNGFYHGACGGITDRGLFELACKPVDLTNRRSTNR